MTYDDCLRTSLVLPQSWAALAVGAALAAGLLWLGHRKMALGAILASVLVAAVWAEVFYDLNCVELLL
jgi:hypothetical protein